MSRHERDRLFNNFYKSKNSRTWKISMYNEWKHLLKTKIDIICLLIFLMTREKMILLYI